MDLLVGFNFAANLYACSAVARASMMRSRAIETYPDVSVAHGARRRVFPHIFQILSLLRVVSCWKD
jgi:hypothetical protein